MTNHRLNGSLWSLAHHRLKSVFQGYLFCRTMVMIAMNSTRAFKRHILTLSPMLSFVRVYNTPNRPVRNGWPWFGFALSTAAFFLSFSSSPPLGREEAEREEIQMGGERFRGLEGSARVL